MKIDKKIFIVFLSFIAFLLLFNLNSYAGTQNWNSLNYDVTVNSDGSMNVVETWDITISETNTVFKDFDIDYAKYSGITNVKVTRVADNEIPLKQIYEEQYHVDFGCYYALPIENNKFEIAWNVGLDNTSDTRTYKIYYTVENAVKIYNDCTELYWQFLGTDNNIKAKNVTGTIKLPQNVSDIEKLRVWAHGPLSGEIKKVSNNEVSFSVPSLPINTRLEVRIVTEENIYQDAIRISTQKMLNSILSEEKEWADQANIERNISKISYGICILIVLGIFVLFCKKNKKYKLMEQEIKEKYYIEVPQIQYFRDIPNEEKATPANASYLYNLSANEYAIETYMGKIFSATILDLSLKGLISFEPIDKKQFKIIFNVQNSNVFLSEDEKEIYNVLVDVHREYDKTRNYITTKELSKYTSSHYEEINKIKDKIKSIVEINQKMSKNIDTEKFEVVEKIQKENMKNIWVFFIMLFIAFMFSGALIAIFRGWFLITLIAVYIETFIGTFWCGSTIGKMLKSITILSEKGCREQQEWKGLKKYMEDYSLLKEKSVPDIVLWEKFLVYATTFGISKKVIEQLKVVHPEMFNVNNNSYYGGYAYWGMVTNPNFEENCFSNFSKNLENAYRSAESAYTAAHSSSSSGSGGGGGFSGGGGGRRRRRRLRRSLNSKKIK